MKRRDRIEQLRSKRKAGKRAYEFFRMNGIDAYPIYKKSSLTKIIFKVDSDGIKKGFCV